LDDFIAQAESADLVVALGDYSCDSGFTGLNDDAAFASASECLQKIREKFKDRFFPVMGDHELGKKPLGADIGGLRLKSVERAGELAIEPFWQFTVGNYVLIGVTSTLIAFPVFAAETLPEERPAWEKLRNVQLEAIRAAFQNLQPAQRVILFCHDPTALPFLRREEAVQQKLGQVERTLIGHLHSNLFLFKSRILAGMPTIPFLGHSVKRFSSALRQARHWKPFKLLLCPSLSGIELLKDGGYYTADLDPQAAHFQFHHLKRR
jgi:hypothetical protein